ncbi:Palmitoyltransferase [Elasticomyces elasticus]|nr:Palmitoyltransferase [Elasticomyces elasticus]
MAKPLLQRVAPVVSTVIISFLAYPSQWLFYYIEPGPLRKGDAYIFNLLVASALFCYYRACFTDPGSIPLDWQNSVRLNGSASDAAQLPLQQRWCRKCEMYKPPRAHHCKTCKRCIMKMDHHCVWTANCVSHVILPHFIRLLSFSVVAMIYLEGFLYSRCAILWEKRNLPSYLGPGSGQLALLFILVVANSFILFAISMLLGRTLWSLGLNMTTIEGWEVERHEAVVRRARASGGLLNAPDGKYVRVEHQEFPWDIGIWKNICRGMGSSNPIAWIWPFARSPTMQNPSKPWPPIDPDRMFRAVRHALPSTDAVLSLDVESFRGRQAADLARYEDADGEYVVRRRPFHERAQVTLEAEKDVYEGESDDEEAMVTDDELEPAGAAIVHGDEEDGAGEESWRNREGERLADFGVDEVADFYDEDDMPLAELLKRRKAEKSQ